jgi:hypothetical protein
MEKATPEPTIKQNKKCHHLPLIIILAVLFVGAGIFGGIMLAQNLQKNDEISELKAKKDEPTTQSNNGSGNTGKTDPTDPTDPELTHGKVTITVSTKLKRVKVGDYYYYDLTLKDNDDGDFFINDSTIRFTNEDGEFGGIVFEEDVTKSFKIDGVVIQAMSAHFGNGGENDLVFLTSDGSVYVIGIEDYDKNNRNFAMKKLEGVSNIVKLRGGSLDIGSGSDVFAIDANGKATALWEKFRKLDH